MQFLFGSYSLCSPSLVTLLITGALVIDSELQIEMDSPDFRLSLGGGMTKDGYLAVPMDKPIKFATSITPEITEYVLI